MKIKQMCGFLLTMTITAEILNLEVYTAGLRPEEPKVARALGAFSQK